MWVVGEHAGVQPAGRGGAGDAVSRHIPNISGREADGVEGWWRSGATSSIALATEGTTGICTTCCLHPIPATYWIRTRGKIPGLF